PRLLPSTLSFPYTTLFRSRRVEARLGEDRQAPALLPPVRGVRYEFSDRGQDGLRLTVARSELVETLGRVVDLVLQHRRRAIGFSAGDFGGNVEAGFGAGPNLTGEQVGEIERIDDSLGSGGHEQRPP